VLEEFVARCNQSQGAEKSEVLFGDHALGVDSEVARRRLVLTGRCPASTDCGHGGLSVLVGKLETGHYLIVIDEARHLETESMELLRYLFDVSKLGPVLVGTL